jgi:hypothetical protein
MGPALYSICFSDIFNQVASYLGVSDIANIANTNTRFAHFVKETGLLYRHISLSFKSTNSRKPLSDESIRKLLPSLQHSRINAATVTSLSIRHRFSGYLPIEENLYATRIAKVFAHCPNLSSLSLHLNNFSTSYYATPPYNFQKVPDGATRAFLCQAITEYGDTMKENLTIIENILAPLNNLRSLDWCIECRPSGLLSEDWKASRLREELEMIHTACPKLEHLGILNFFDSRVSDAIFNEISLDGKGDFIRDGDNAISGILPNVKDMTYYVAGDRDQEKILSAMVLAMMLGHSRDKEFHFAMASRETVSKSHLRRHQQNCQSSRVDGPATERFT